jgi:hypothetical protein
MDYSQDMGIEIKNPMTPAIAGVGEDFEPRVNCDLCATKGNYHPFYLYFPNEGEKWSLCNEHMGKFLSNIMKKFPEELKKILHDMADEALEERLKNSSNR